MSWNAEKERGYEQPVNENFLKNFPQKVLVVQKFALPLHPLSEKKAVKKSSLKDLDISKQVVQDLSNDK